MSEIKSIIKIKSAIRSSFANNKYATVLNNGDQNNGIILLKLLRKDNKSRLLGRSINEHGRYDWRLSPRSTLGRCEPHPRCHHVDCSSQNASEG